MNQCDKCLYTEIADWEIVMDKAVPILWCEKKKKMCNDIEDDCLMFDSGENDQKEF